MGALGPKMCVVVFVVPGTMLFVWGGGTGGGVSGGG